MATIHHEATFKASAERIYDALTQADKFSAFTGGAPANIDGGAGGAFTLFGGHIEGRNVELVPGKRVVQAWRAKDWAPGHYSIVRFELAGRGDETRIVFDHIGFPEEHRVHLEPGWQKMYFEPLKAYVEA
jgi:activator of HSP90 ATPase